MGLVLKLTILLLFFFVFGGLVLLPLVGEDANPTLTRQVFALPETFHELGLDENLPAQALLKKHGMVFPVGSSARFVKTDNVLEVTNLKEELMISEAVVTLWERIANMTRNAKRVKHVAKIEKKLSKIMIPLIDFKNTPLTDALKFLEKASVEFDTTAENEDEKGIAISLELYEKIESKPAEATDSFGFESGGESIKDQSSTTLLGLNTNAVPLREALRYTLSLNRNNLKYSVTESGVVVSPLHHEVQPLETMVYLVSPKFREQLISQCNDLMSPDCFPEDPFRTKKDPGEENRETPERTIKDGMEIMGISFPLGSFSQLLEERNLLVVKNTTDQIELIEFLIEMVNAKASVEWKSRQEALIKAKLASIQLPNLSFEEASFTEVGDRLEWEIARLDSESKIWNQGIMFNLKKDNSDLWSEHWTRKVSISLENNTAAEAIEKLSAKLGWKTVISPRGVVFLTN